MVFDTVCTVGYQTSLTIMKIGIDARLLNETGVGKYIRNLIKGLELLDKKNQYIIYTPNVPWHSFSEQLIMPILFLKDRLDFVHIPYFNVPIFYPGKFIVTIHDLTILHFDTGKASTLPLPLYKLRRLGYWIALFIGLHRAVKIIAVSETTKKEIIDHFHINPDKIIVTYEGVDPLLPTGKRIIKEPYFLYVGNAYPHKNLEILIGATPIQLVLVGKQDFFYNKLPHNRKIVLFGEASEGELQNLYKNATALVFPSLMEGFGLPGLEAMAVGTPVVCSDIPVFHEIYADAALYFDPKSEKDMKSKLELVQNTDTRNNLIKKGFSQVKKYSWEKMARQTLVVFLTS